MNSDYNLYIKNGKCIKHLQTVQGLIRFLVEPAAWYNLGFKSSLFRINF